MEKIEREVLDFMNVESFSQLPFIRPVKEKSIRLFGKEFGDGDDTCSNTMITTNMSESIDSNPFHYEPETSKVNPMKYSSAKESHVGKNKEIIRKYECQYCFRNFSTSQALGGHQNAHKKERQNAKRAHLQSSIMHEPSDYRVLNRHLIGTRTHQHSTWTNINNSTTRLYGNGYNFNVISPNYSQTTTNRSPLAFWQQISPAVKISSNCEKKIGYKPKEEVKDHLSLDLHL